MVLHMDQDRVRLNGQNGHSHNGHKNREDLHGHLLGEWTGAPSVPADKQIQERKVDYPKLLELGRELLVAIGEDPSREGLLDTPRRWADWWREFIEYKSWYNRDNISFDGIRSNGVCFGDAGFLALRAPSLTYVVRCIDWLYYGPTGVRTFQICTYRPSICASITGSGAVGRADSR